MTNKQVSTFSEMMDKVSRGIISPQVASKIVSSTFGRGYDGFDAIFDCFTVLKQAAINVLEQIFKKENVDETANLMQRANISLYGLNDDVPTFETSKIERKETTSEEQKWMFGFTSIHKKRNLIDWHDSLLTKQQSQELLDRPDKVTFEDYAGAYVEMTSRFRNLPFETQKHLKYCGRIVPPHVLDKGKRYASGGAIKLQQINEIAPEFLKHAFSILNPCCGAGGFEQFMSWLGTQENEPKRRVYYQTLTQPNHEMPNVNILNIEKSKTTLIKCTEVNNCDIRDPVVQQNLKKLEYDTLFIDMGEGDNDLNNAANWWMRSARQQLNSVNGELEWNAFVAKYNLDIAYGEPKGNTNYIKGITICGRPGHQNAPKTQVPPLHKPKFDVWLKNYSHQKRKDNYLTEIVYKPADLLLENIIAHCISSDLQMSKGLAKSISEIYGKPSEKEKISPNLFVTNQSKKIVCHLVTKDLYYDKPTVESLWNALITLKEYLLEHKIYSISMPKIACGLDQMNWSLVENMLRFIFHKTNVKITICTTDQVPAVITTVAEERNSIYCYTSEGFRKSYLNIFKKIVEKLETYRNGTVAFNLDKIPVDFRIVVEHMLRYLSVKYSLTFDNRVNFNEARGWSSNLTAVQNLINNMQVGGKILLRQAHIHKNSFYVLNQLLKNFKNIKVIKLPTCSNISGEFYILATNFNPNFIRQTENKILEIIVPIMEEAENKFLEFEKICRKPLKYADKYIIRSNWFDVNVNTLTATSIQVVDENEPNSFRLHTPSEGIDVTWTANWKNRMALIEQNVRKFDKKFSFKKEGRKWEALYTLGSYTRGAKPYRNITRHNTDALIEEGASRIFGITKATSSYGPTQDTLKHTNESYTKRLDRDPGIPESTYLYDLQQAMKYHRTEYGKGLKNLEPLSKDETLAMINPKGSVGIFDRGGTLSQFVVDTPDWYERAFTERIIPWSKGEDTAEYYSVRNKLESKKRKDADESGLLDYKPGQINQEQLIENSEMAARQITFADSLTRIAHLIIDGRRVHLHSHNKTYQGSITGTPPQYQGRVLKTLWEIFEGKCESGYLEDRDAYLEVDPVKSNATGATILDFATFDFTETIAERVLQTYNTTKYYGDAFIQKALLGAARHTAFSINVNDFGDVFGKQGMRNSGEIWTSIDNTELASSHVLTGISRITGIPISELTKPIGKLYYYIGGGIPDCMDIEYIKKEAAREVPIICGIKKKWKSYEICKICLLADGDDIVILGPKEIISKVARYIDKVVVDGNKVLRSQDKSGVAFVTNFDEISFCSHKYRQVVVDPGPLAP